MFEIISALFRVDFAESLLQKTYTKFFPSLCYFVYVMLMKSRGFISNSVKKKEYAKLPRCFRIISNRTLYLKICFDLSTEYDCDCSFIFENEWLHRFSNGYGTYNPSHRERKKNQGTWHCVF